MHSIEANATALLEKLLLAFDIALTDDLAPPGRKRAGVGRVDPRSVRLHSRRAPGKEVVGRRPLIPCGSRSGRERSLPVGPRISPTLIVKIESCQLHILIVPPTTHL